MTSGVGWIKACILLYRVFVMENVFQIDSAQLDIHDYSQLSVFVADSDYESALALKDALKENSIGNIEYFHNVNQLRSVLNRRYPDILIIDSFMEDPRQVQKLIIDVRNSMVGLNPFIYIFALVKTPNRQTLRTLVSIGVDKFFIKPLNMQYFLTRLEHTIVGREPFVVSSSYIGPDRRSDTKRLNLVALIDPPNSLKDKILGAKELYEAKLKQAINRLNHLRIKRNAIAIAFYITWMEDIIRNHNHDKSDLHLIAKGIAEIVYDYSYRSSPVISQEMLALCEVIYKSIEHYASHPEAITLESMNNLSEQAYSLAHIVNPERTQDNILREVVNSYKEQVERRGRNGLKTNHNFYTKDIKILSTDGRGIDFQSTRISEE